MDVTAPGGGSQIYLTSGWSKASDIITKIGQLFKHPGYEGQTGDVQFWIDVGRSPYRPDLFGKIQTEAASAGIESITGVDPGEAKEWVGLGILALFGLVAFMGVRKL